MASACDEDVVEVEYFKTASGSFMKYGYIVMENPEFGLRHACDYLSWLQNLKDCAANAGLLALLEGKAVRPSTPGVQQEAFDKKQAALNNFIVGSTDEKLGFYSIMEHWQENTKNTHPFNKTKTSEVLEALKDMFCRDSLFEEFATTFRDRDDDDDNASDAIERLNDEWDNLKELAPDAPDMLYYCAAWSLMNDYDLFQLRYVFYLPSGRTSVASVRRVLESRVHVLKDMDDD